MQWYFTNLVPPLPPGINKEEWEAHWHLYNSQLRNDIQQQLLIYQANPVYSDPLPKTHITNSTVTIKKSRINWEVWFPILIIITAIATIFSYKPVTELMGENLNPNVQNNVVAMIQSNDKEEIQKGDLIGSWTVSDDFHGVRPLGASANDPNSRLHSAIDLVKSEGETEGQPIYMPFNGEVQFVTDAGCGNGALITQKESNISVTLCHLQNPPKQGEVKQGEVIANVGNTGIGSDAHLHVMVRNGEEIRHVSKELVNKLIEQ